MSTFTVQMDEDQFRICGPDGEEGELVSYDGVAFLAIGDEVYFCRVDNPDAETQRVECVTQTKAMPTAIEDSEFQEEEEEAAVCSECGEELICPACEDPGDGEVVAVEDAAA